MKLRLFSVVSFLCLSILFGAQAGSAQQVQPLEPEWLRQMYEEGWEKVQEGVLRRDAGDGQFETFSYGAEGLQWVLEGFTEQLSFLEERYNEAPSEDLAEVIETVQREIDKVSENLGETPSAEAVDASAFEECTQKAFGGNASAGPMQSPQGITATATAYFQNACGIIGDTAAVAYADAIDAVTGLHDTHNQEDPSQGIWIDSSATASAVGSTGCSSWAQATVSINGDMVFQTPLAQSSNCSLSVLATITGPATATADYYTNPCADVTWTASATQGTPGYSYEWYIGTALQGTGSTFTKSYCNVSTSATVKVVATDAQGGTDDATFTTNIQYIGPLVATVNGPSSVATNSSTPCANVTWTASVSGAHPGYTYSWYLGTDTTVQGTGSTLTKQYCNTSTSVAAKVVVRDSDGHTAEATKTTTITHTAPVMASITGPATATTDYYINSGCVNVTWTASATQGTPGYTYQWYIGTAPQGTGPTLTKSYCNTSQSVTVRVVATDTQGGTDDATFTTNLQYIRQLNASVTGPTSVATNASTPCANVTWTASATRAHPGYTYSWYIGTGTTVLGTGSTFTKQYCNTSTSVTVKVVARDSDGHTDDATMTTTITYTPPSNPPTASISGPSEVWIAYGECPNISWTASATGGSSGYTYTWYLGTSTTAAGTGSTLTKNFCGAQTINVKVVVRDSAAQTDDATFTTIIRRERIDTGCVPGQVCQ